jgi:hypothetical protein
MEKTLKIFFIGIAAFGLLFGTLVNATAKDENKDNQPTDSSISILSYALKPVGYIEGDRFVESNLDMDLKNNEGANQKANVIIRFYDKDKNMLKEVTKPVSFKANETKKLNYKVLLDPSTAKKVTSTQAEIENNR